MQLTQVYTDRVNKYLCLQNVYSRQRYGLQVIDDKMSPFVAASEIRS